MILRTERLGEVAIELALQSIVGNHGGLIQHRPFGATVRFQNRLHTGVGGSTRKDDDGSAQSGRLLKKLFERRDRA